MEMKHRIVSITTAFVTVLSLCSAFCLTAQPVSAASKTKSVYIMNTAVEQESTGRYEKIGKYYFWTERYGSTYLKCATSISGKAKKLDTAKNNMEISPCIVTDGQQIYYTINKYDRDDYSTRKPISSTFYKTTVKGKKQKIKTVSSAVDLYAYYNGKLYYGYGNPEPATKATLYVYDTVKKTTKKLKNNFEGRSSYGKYITYRNQANGKNYIYNVTTGKSKRLPAGKTTVVYGKNIYYYVESKDGATATIKTCNLSGKQSKIIKKNLKYLCYFGRTRAYCSNIMTGEKWQLVYKTKKLTKVHRIL